MENSKIILLLDGILDQLAAIEHERWSHWQRYMHSKGKRKSDGSLVIPPNLVEQWERQMNTEYQQLSEKEKKSDIEQVEKYLPLIKKTLTDRR